MVPPSLPDGLRPGGAAAGGRPWRGAGVVEDLLDIRFTRFVGLRLMSLLYVTVLVAVSLGALVYVLAAFLSNPGAGLVALVTAVLVWLFVVVLTRAALEAYALLFRIHDAAERIADGASAPAGPPPVEVVPPPGGRMPGGDGPGARPGSQPPVRVRDVPAATSAPPGRGPGSGPGPAPALGRFGGGGRPAEDRPGIETQIFGPPVHEDVPRAGYETPGRGTSPGPRGGAPAGPPSGPYGPPYDVPDDDPYARGSAGPYPGSSTDPYAGPFDDGYDGPYREGAHVWDGQDETGDEPPRRRVPPPEEPPVRRWS
jgi:hypothetical protein